jgi:peptide/nickel transport system substrate-binding protein
MLHRVRRLAAGVLLAPLLGACAAHPARTSTAPASSPGQVFSISYVNDAPVPAPEVPGARQGGTLTLLSPFDFQNIDPAQMGLDTETILSELIYRTLTATRENGKGGLDVIGDLATSPGESSDGGRTWKYTLRDGIRFADGQPITSHDIAYGIARSFAPELALGSRILDQWLAGSADYNKTYKGPYSGAGDIPPGVSVPDDRTIVFHFDKPRPEFPFLAASSTTAPVPKDKDTRDKYANAPVASGPYRIDSYVHNQKLVLVRNPNWDRATDPLRHQYVDGVTFTLGVTALQISQRLIADQGTDQTATTFWSTAPEVLPQVVGDPAVMRRLTQGPTGTVQYLYINTARVTDLKVRQALNYAVDRDSFIKAQGGPLASAPATTILPPLTPGYQNYNAYPGGPTGDPAKARSLLGGRTVPLTMALGTSPVSQRRGLALKSALERAGFQITLQPLAGASYYAQVSKRGNPYDLILGGNEWVWADGSMLLRDQFDGRQIRDQGSDNFSFLNDPAINTRMDELTAQTDRAKAVAGWGQLDRQLMEKDAPVVPLAYIRCDTLSGSRVGGIFVNLRAGLPSLRDVYVKPASAG